MNEKVTQYLIVIVSIITFTIVIVGTYKYIQVVEVEPSVPADGEATAFPESARVSPASEGGGVVPTSSSPLTSPNVLGIKIVSERPVAGGVFTTDKSGKLVVRYMERENGHVSELTYNEKLPRKLSNTTITRVHQAFFNNTGTNVLVRRLDESNNVQNISAALEDKAGTSSSALSVEDMIGKLKQSLLSQNIKEVAVSPARDKILYLTEIGGDFSGTIEDFGRQKIPFGKKQVFSSPIGEWQISWPEATTLFFNTKPSVAVPGYLYMAKVNRSGLTKILGDVNGLTSSASPNLKELVYSESSEGGINTYLYNIVKKERRVLPIKTLPEKCVWGGVESNILYCAVPSDIPSGEYPDAWYQGTASFDDEIWKIDTRNGSSELLTDKSALSRNGGVDATDLNLSQNEEYLLLINKKTSALWQIKIK